MKITVLGPGCPSCKILHAAVLNVVGDRKDMEVEYITDINVMISKGIMSSPALLIEEELVFAGRIPSEDEILEKIKEFEEK